MATKNEILAKVTSKEIAQIASEQGCSVEFVKTWMQKLSLNNLKWDYETVSADDAAPYFLHEAEFTLAEFLDRSCQRSGSIMPSKA